MWSIDAVDNSFKKGFALSGLLEELAGFFLRLLQGTLQSLSGGDVFNDLDYPFALAFRRAQRRHGNLGIMRTAVSTWKTL